MYLQILFYLCTDAENMCSSADEKIFGEIFRISLQELRLCQDYFDDSQFMNAHQKISDLECCR